MKNSTDWTLVTGGARRLGAQICKSLAQNGYPVLIHYNTSCKEAQDLIKECRASGVSAESIQGDFSSIQTLQDFLQRLKTQFPQIKNIVNNVGNYRVESTLATNIQEWHELFQTNLHAPVALIKELMLQIKKQKGSIINIGVAGIENVPANTYSSAYTASKLALWMVTKSLAKEFAPFHVRVNMVSPGMLDNAVDLPPDQKILPMKRAGTPIEVARVVLFLLDENNTYITGQNIEVAGGLRL